MYYIQEIDKPNGFLKLFNIIKIKEDKIILPITGEIKIGKAEKLARKTMSILESGNSRKVVLSKKVSKREDYINFLYSNGAEIVDGRWLFKALTLQVLDYIVEKKRLKKEEIQVSILMNDVDLNMLDIIKQIVKQYKAVNIVTNHFEKFRRVEQQILEEEGLMITVTNNKKKSLYKSQIILNVDFPSELVNRYRIYDEAIIINLRGDVRIETKRFNGLNIVDYEIEFNNSDNFDYEKENLYDNKNVYEANIYKNRSFKYLQEMFLRDKVKIKYLKGIKNIL